MSQKKHLSDLKVAIVCDWLTNVGGAERVVKSLHEMFPEAPIYTSQYDPDKINWFVQADVRAGWMNRLPRHMHKFFPLLRCVYFSRLNLSQYDLVISSTGAEAKAVKTRHGAVHISYMHAPTQYYWSLYDDYVKKPGFGWLDPLARIALRILVRPMRFLDKRFAQRPNYIISNSTYVKDEIKKYYDRDSVTIFPAVQVEKFSKLPTRKREGFAVTSRQMPWKRLDIAVEACKLLGEKLVVVGHGSEHNRLVRLAEGAPNILFLPTQDDAGIGKVLSQAEGFIFPSHEPFGIAPVEALSAGTPVIAYGAGGALDYVVDGQNGILFKPQTTQSLSKALRRFRTLSFSESSVKASATHFSTAHFKKELRSFIEQVVINNEQP